MTRLQRVLVVSGIPGAGKTTLARVLADRHERGVHLEADVFLGFLAHPVDPLSLESTDQAQAMARAVGVSAASLADSGYRVVVDGVIGPWHLEILTAALGPFDYAILNAEPSVAVDRMHERGDSEIDGAGVSMLHRFFEEYPALLARHGITTQAPTERLADEIAGRIGRDELLFRGEPSD